MTYNTRGYINVFVIKTKTQKVTDQTIVYHSFSLLSLKNVNLQRLSYTFRVHIIELKALLG